MGSIMGDDLTICVADALACMKQQAAALERLAALQESKFAQHIRSNAAPVENVADHLEQPLAPVKNISDHMGQPPGVVRERSASPNPRRSSRTDLTIWSNCEERPPSALLHKWEQRLSKQPMSIEVNVTFLSIEGIDTVGHSFSANIIADFRVWYAGDLHDFDPKIRCSNLKESTMEGQMSQCKSADGSYCFRRQWHGVFLEHLELHDFPMDIQNLSIEFTSEWPADMVKFLRSRSHESKVTAPACDITRDVWAPTTIKELKSARGSIMTLSCCKRKKEKSARSVAIRSREDVVEGAGLDDDRLYPMITFTLQFSRLTQYYLWNVIMPTCIMVTLAFTSFTVPLNEVADRASITLTLLLSIIAYKFIIKDELPKVNFMTLIDKYILASMSIVAVLGFANAIVGNGAEEITEDLLSADRLWKWILGIMWTFCNFYFVCNVAWRQYKSQLRLRRFRKQCCAEAASAADVMLLV
mmetsp:Transcript_4171/g.6713  ORF Transcript_4171/g.6713 Transcript_4171/m.6713 type:complete len:471 (-) Transcript_4171:46-1458(-)